MTIEYGNELENIGSESGDCNMTTGKYNGLLGALQRNVSITYMVISQIHIHVYIYFFPPKLLYSHSIRKRM